MNSNQPLTSSPDTMAWAGPFVLERGKLERVLTPAGYIKVDTAYYCLRDHQGSVRQVVSGADGSVVQENQYYPYGSLHGESSAQALLSSNGAAAQPYKYGGKEHISLANAHLLDFTARTYDPASLSFYQPDPLQEKFLRFSSYLYCAANPINHIDPTGMSTWVVPTGDGRYEIVGGDINDGDLSIYVGHWNEDKTEFVREGSIGVTNCITTFYISESGSWSTKSYIDPSDESGKVFLNDMMSNPPFLFLYMYNAQYGYKYDFKVTNGTSQSYTKLKEFYRGMPIFLNEEGVQVYSSARDIGNMAAGFMAANNGIPYWAAREAFDLYQGNKEGDSTQNAESYGWQLGNANTSSFEKTMNFINVTNTIFNYGTLCPAIGASLVIYNLYRVFSR